MADLLDYLDWRGDIPFSTDPFNYVDALILAELAYVDFAGIVPGPENGDGAHPYVLIDTVAQEFWKRHTPEEIERSEVLFRRAPLLLKKLCSGVRFGGMYLAGYTNRISAQKNEQMAALVFYLEDGSAYAAFRGTDDTVIGWKEDFSFSFRKETSGQTSAAQYLSEVFGKSDLQRIRVGGHSKGGNFSVYASAFSDENVRSRISDIYTFDGPGLLEEVTATREYREILPRVHSIVPEEALFGLLLDCGYYHKVVESSAKGIWQHDPLTWKVMRNRFVEAEGISEGSLVLVRAVESWIREMSLEERREVVDLLFSLIEDSGYENVSEIRADQFLGIPELLRTYREMDTTEKEVLRNTVGNLLKSGVDSVSRELLGRITRRKKE